MDRPVRGGASGILSGNRAQLSIDAFLDVIRWTGWGIDPNTGKSNDQTPYPGYVDQSGHKNVVSFDASGGNLFHDEPPQGQNFDPQMPYDLAVHFIAIPGRAVTLFEVELRVSYGFPDGDDEYDNVTLDLAYDPLGYMVRCPQVVLEILTPTAR
jgi:hypothetical protein